MVSPLPRFRAGRDLGRTVYVQWAALPDDTDTLIGMMDSAELGHIVAAALDLFYHQNKRNRARLEAAIAEREGRRVP